MTPELPATTKTNRTTAAAGAALAALIVWAYWPALGAMADKWWTDPQYSHGYLVPLFAVGLAVWRRKDLDRANCRTDWRGLILVAVGALAYVAGGYLYLDSLAGLALIPTLLGVVLLVGGPAALRWAWPMVAFLVFMVPLPFSVEHALGRPLQGVATRGSTWVLQTLGLPAVSEGHTILLEHGRIAVVEACSGLSMLLTFAAMTTGMAMVISRPLLDRAVIVLSTIPLAVAVNIARISGNGVGIEFWDAKTAHEWFHDRGGMLMMPLAFGLLGLELWVLGRLLVPAKAPARPVPVSIITPAAAPKKAAPVAS